MEKTRSELIRDELVLREKQLNNTGRQQTARERAVGFKFIHQGNTDCNFA
jgi:hypothetical protein